MLHHLRYTDFGGRKQLTKEERDALNTAAKGLTEQSVSELRSAWRAALKKEAEGREAEIDELCRTHDLAQLNTKLSELLAVEAALPPLPLGFIRSDCYACALPIAGPAVRGAHGRMFHERCFVCRKCETHLSALAPTCVALYDAHYCMPCGARFDPLDPLEHSAAASPAKALAASEKTPSKEADAAKGAAGGAEAKPAAAESPAQKADTRDQARERLLNAFSKLSHHVDEMDEEEKKLVAKIAEEEAALKDMQRKQRVERFRARQGSLNLPPGQRPSGAASLDAVMAAVKEQRPDEIDAETQKSLQKEQKIYESEQARKKAEQQERLMRFKAGLTERKTNEVSRSADEIGRSSDSVEDEEAEKRRKEQEILDLIAEEERRRMEEERDRQVKNVRYFLDDLKESTLAVLEREATGGRVSANELDVVQRNLERADRLFGGDDTLDAAATEGGAAPEGRFERTLDKLLALMENPDALSKLATLVSPNVAPQGQSHIAFYEKVKQDTEWARRQREARQAELASMRRN